MFKKLCPIAIVVGLSGFCYGQQLLTNLPPKVNQAIVATFSEVCTTTESGTSCITVDGDKGFTGVDGENKISNKGNVYILRKDASNQIVGVDFMTPTGTVSHFADSLPATRRAKTHPLMPYPNSLSFKESGTTLQRIPCMQQLFMYGSS